MYLYLIAPLTMLLLLLEESPSKRSPHIPFSDEEFTLASGLCQVMQIPSLGVLNEGNGNKSSPGAEEGDDVPTPLGALRLGFGAGPERSSGTGPVASAKGASRNALRRAHTEKLKPILGRGSNDAGSDRAKLNAASPTAASPAMNAAGAAGATAPSSAAVAGTPASESSAEQSDSPHTELNEPRAEGCPASAATAADEQSEPKSLPTSAATIETPTDEKESQSPSKKGPSSQLSPSRSKCMRTGPGAGPGQLSASGSRARLTPPRDLDDRRGALTPSDLEHLGDHNRPVRKVKSDASRPPGDEGPLQKNSGGDSGTTTSLDESVQRAKEPDEDAKANVPKVRVHL